MDNRDPTTYEVRESPFEKYSSWREILLASRPYKAYQVRFHIESIRDFVRGPRYFAAIWIYIDITIAQAYAFSLNSVVVCIGESGTYPNSAHIAKRVFPSFDGVSKYITSFDPALPRVERATVARLLAPRPQQSLLETETLDWLSACIESEPQYVLK
jgi:hypothetical protein